jgi:hypothetical protein
MLIYTHAMTYCAIQERQKMSINMLFEEDTLINTPVTSYCRNTATLSYYEKNK